MRFHSAPAESQYVDMKVEDQAGFEPAMSLRCRLKRPARSAATVTGPMIVFVEDASGYDPQADGLKVRSLSIRV